MRTSTGSPARASSIAVQRSPREPEKLAMRTGPALMQGTVLLRRVGALLRRVGARGSGHFDAGDLAPAAGPQQQLQRLAGDAGDRPAPAGPLLDAGCVGAAQHQG